MGFTGTTGSLAELIGRGGIYRDVGGTTPREVLAAFTGTLPPLPSAPADRLLRAVLEREALMPTGIGNGIALPHPRNPIITDRNDEFAALAFLEHRVDWNALDGEKVDTLFLIVSASAKQHLRTLAEVTFFCRTEDFCRLLRERVPGEELLRYIEEAEKNWK